MREHKYFVFDDMTYIKSLEVVDNNLIKDKVAFTSGPNLSTDAMEFSDIDLLVWNDILSKFKGHIMTVKEN